MFFSPLPRDMGYGSHQRQRGVLTPPPHSSAAPLRGRLHPGRGLFVGREFL